MSTSNENDAGGNTKKTKKKPPPSREAELRYINTTINEVAMEIKKHAKLYFKDSCRKLDYAGCHKCLIEIMDMWKCTSDDIPIWKEFQELQKTKKIDKDTLKTEEFLQLATICDRANDFELMFPTCREKLNECLSEHVYKYCDSYIEEIGGQDVRPVIEFDEAISSYRNVIEAKLNKVNVKILQYGEKKTPFESFVKEGSSHGTVIEDVCVLLVEVCQKVKKWVHEDTGYPDQLWQEIQFNNSYKDTLKNEILVMNSKLSNYNLALERKVRVKKDIDADYEVNRKDKKKLHNSIEVIQDKMKRHDRDIETKQKEADKLDKKLSNKAPSSPRANQEQRLKAQDSREELKKLEDKRDTMKKQLNRVEKDYKEVSDKTYESKMEVISNQESQDDLKNKIINTDSEMKAGEERTQIIEGKNVLLKKIRDIKLSSDTLRKMQTGKQPVPHQQEREDLDGACEEVAKRIGPGWKQLYETLPFDPPRDRGKRAQDTDNIKYFAAKQDKTVKQQAQQSLAKWRNFHRTADIVQLIKALRRIEKTDLARRLDDMYVVGDIYT